MFRRIRSRLIAAFAAPLVILLAVTATTAWVSVRNEQSVTRETDVAVAANGPTGIVSALQYERDEATAGMVGVAGQAHLPVKSNADARNKTDQALAAFRASVAGSGPSVQAVYRPALAALSNLAAVRAQVDAFKGAESLSNPSARAADVAAFDRYRSLVDGFLSAVSTAPGHISDPQLRSSVETLDLFLNQSESLTVLAQQMFAASILQSSKGISITPASDFGAFQLWTQRLSAYSSGPDGAMVTQVINAANRTGQAMLPYVQAATAGISFDVVGFANAAGATTTNASGENVWQQGADVVGRHISSRAGTLHDQARLQVLVYGSAVAASLLLGLLLLIRVSRSISRPLTRLADDARRMAEKDLPEAVDAIFRSEAPATESPGPAEPGTRLKEVAEVSVALDGVRRTALELATGQARLRRKVADAFVNLGRRNQNLVTRQLEVLTQIERHEDDPATLEELFRLDHLATRMRRHAESLLVIAGSGASPSWSEAASAVDVVRAASAEVEDYRRISLHHFDHAVVTASLTADLVHILAELMENALSYSPPHSSVGLYGRALDDGYTISVVDAGVGMSVDAREAANRRLSSGGDLDDAASRQLGLVVAGRLASRQGVTVTLHESESGGTAARIRIPAPLIESSVAAPADSRPPVGVEPSRDGTAVADAGIDPIRQARLTVDPADAPAQEFPAYPMAPAQVPEPDGAHFTRSAALPRRVPGASLPEAEDGLRRDRTSTDQTPWAVSYALSDYLTNRADPIPGRPSPESPDAANH